MHLWKEVSALQSGNGRIAGIFDDKNGMLMNKDTLPPTIILIDIKNSFPNITHSISPLLTALPTPKRERVK